MPDSPQRYKLIIAYRGTNYHGWQRQTPIDSQAAPNITPEGRNIPTIQETLARAMAHVVGQPVHLCGSSRTDSGVHAKGQVAHFDTDQTQIPIEGLRMAVNARLPSDILIRKITAVPPTFDAITSTISKRYQYQIWNTIDRPVFFADLAWHRWQPLDLPAMRNAAARLIGEHDFASFARAGHGRDSTVRTVLSCDVSSRGNRLVIGVEGTGFLWNMVRIMVGTLVEVGLGQYTPDDMDKMLAAKDRQSAGRTAPAHGLYLQWIRHA